MAVAISLRAVSKVYPGRGGAPDVTAVDNVELDIEAGEFFALLGPSGSGKTSLLRLIGGFELPTAGSIYLDGVDVTSAPPFDRDVNTVFQDYALFPHMNVVTNVEYGLAVKGVAKPERRKRAEEALAAVRLGDLGARKPGELSGGQRQRVALARALVNRPKVLLLDEPLGALDLKLREEMQVELKALQRDVGITFVFVTHDQGEALGMSDRVAVFERGTIAQVDTPRRLYEHPATAFVAGFVGTSNLLEGPSALALLGAAGPFTVRPERCTVRRADHAPTPGLVSARGKVLDSLYLGASSRVRVALDAGAVVVADAREPWPVGDTVELEFDPNDARLLAGSSGR